MKTAAATLDEAQPLRLRRARRAFGAEPDHA
jgi:hypothetical protein